VNAATEANGCLWVLPGSHARQGLYPGTVTKAAHSRPAAGGVLSLELLPEDVPKRVFLPLAAGDMSIHEVGCLLACGAPLSVWGCVHVCVGGGCEDGWEWGNCLLAPCCSLCTLEGGGGGGDFAAGVDVRGRSVTSWRGSVWVVPSQEWIVHGSEGNGSPVSRDTLIMAYRAQSMIEFERSLGFRHSYNDPEEVLRLVREHVWE
jgi:hypothetical protein